MEIDINRKLKNNFEGLQALVFPIRGVKVQKKNPELENIKQDVFEEVKNKYTLENLKDISIFKNYRQFFWKVGIDPTKIRPAAEALIRRILIGKSIPNINNLVDAYNLASIKTGIALAAFDEDKLHGELKMRLSKKGENFVGIGMSEPMELQGNEIVVSDNEKLVAIYPYRDAEESKLTKTTKNVILMVCGVPGIEKEKLDEAGDIATNYIIRFCSEVKYQ